MTLSPSPSLWTTPLETRGSLPTPLTVAASTLVANTPEPTSKTRSLESLRTHRLSMPRRTRWTLVTPRTLTLSMARCTPFPPSAQDAARHARVSHITAVLVFVLRANAHSLKQSTLRSLTSPTSRKFSFGVPTVTVLMRPSPSARFPTRDVVTEAVKSAPVVPFPRRVRLSLFASRTSSICLAIS